MHRAARRRYATVLFALALLCLLPACHRTPRPKAKIVTTIFPAYDLARRIAGPDADVIMLEPPEVTPHAYAPSPNDVQRATGASLAVLIGLDLDTWMAALMDRVSPNARVLRLADRVPTLPRQPGLTEELSAAKRNARRAQGKLDPADVDPIDVHVWLDPQRALLMARALTDELCRVDPTHVSDFRTRGLEVTRSLEALDHEIEQRTSSWKQRSFATLHDAFRYYAARYHLEVAVSVESQPGVRPTLRYDQLVLARIRERAPAGIFGEPQLDSQPARTLAQAAQIPYGVLDPLGGTGGIDSYEALIRSNTDVLEKVLLPPRATPAALPSGAPSGASAAPSNPPP